MEQANAPVGEQISGYKMRAPCSHCGSDTGRIERKGNQDCVYCECGKHQYNAPRAETGRERETVTRGTIKPSRRAKVIMRANGRCELCGIQGGETPGGLHIGHVVSVAEGRAAGIPDHILNSDENLIAECAECNLGHRETLPAVVFARILWARAAGQNGKGGA